MAHYQLRLIYKDQVVAEAIAAPLEGGSHPVVGQTVDGKWRIVEILQGTAEVNCVSVEPVAFFTESASYDLSRRHL
jgi:hypothetical protein